MTPDDLDIRRKRLIYRSLYTGMKETDILLGGFARAELPGFDAALLDEYERLLDTCEDPAIYAWAIGREPVPPEHDGEVMRRLKAYKIPL
jgi:succinate dehydrogenase flavin-adding protein (antitoxin of CptAB toxin-antitoxin module)